MPHASLRLRPLYRLLILSFVVVVPLLGGCRESPVAPEVPGEFTVMSRNIYLGFNIFRLGQVQVPQQIPVVAGELWHHLLATNFPERAGALAREVAETNPALIGLQEVVEFRTQRPSDFFTNPVPNAQQLEFDFLAILMDSIQARGLDYRVVARVRNVDAEMPALLNPANPAELVDIRMTEYGVILARGDVQTSNPMGSNYAVSAIMGVGGLMVPMRRGWVKVDAQIGGFPVTFVNTHVEGVAEGHEPQIRELLSVVATFRDPVILVGDLNTQADMSGNPGYRLMVAEGPFRDAYAEVGQLPGYTCCFPGNARGTERVPDERIDFVLYRGNLPRCPRR